MTIRSHVKFAAISVFLVAAASMPAQALTMQECSAKYEAAKKGGTLGDQKWNDFRKAQCGTDAKPAAETKTEAPKATETKPGSAAKPAATPAATSTTAVFPKAIDPKYAKETAGKGRMKTCVDQYNANKATNANGGMKWIEKGGGYYSQCNAKLKV